MSGRESIDFYEKNWSLIVKLFRVDKTYCVNHGFYEKGIRSHVQSVLKMNDLVGDLLKIDFKNHNIKYVLDAGCGIGGTVIHLAKKYPNIKITGITNVKNHIKIAKDNAKQNNVRKNTTFLLKDFIKTGLPSNKFDAIYLIESSSYSQKKRILLQEMYRLLKPGGIIVFIDCFRTNISLNQYLKNFYNLFCKGWAIPNLVELKKFKDYLVLEDFKKITIKDFSKNVERTILRGDILSLPYIAKILLKKTIYGKKYKINKDPDLLALAPVFISFLGLKKAITYNAIVAKK